MKAFTVLTCTLLLAGGALAATERPTLRLIDTDPLTVRGANFKAGEQVSITASFRRDARLVRVSKTARAVAAGTFTAALPGAQAPNCAPWSVSATGASGTHAAVKIVPRCGPPPLR